MVTQDPNVVEDDEKLTFFDKAILESTQTGGSNLCRSSYILTS